MIRCCFFIVFFVKVNEFLYLKTGSGYGWRVKNAALKSTTGNLVTKQEEM
jgi:hypothetical protein